MEIMSEAEEPSSELSPTVRVTPVPVYNCPAYISRPDASGQVNVRCATLPEVTAFGTNQREALGRLVLLFKQTVVGYRTAGLEIPWQEPPLSAEAGESSVYIAVHL
jgi:hypothetical protein